MLARAKSGSRQALSLSKGYKAPPVKRACVPKNEKEDRPIGLPTVEDKILSFDRLRTLSLSKGSARWP